MLAIVIRLNQGDPLKIKRRSKTLDLTALHLKSRVQALKKWSLSLSLKFLSHCLRNARPRKKTIVQWPSLTCLAIKSNPSPTTSSKASL